jgi:natural product biosynthesis luciferase-like monooxygenase protein
MTAREKFSCFIIGSDTLLGECAEIILREGHEIRGIITATPRLITFARSKKIPVLDPKSDYKQSLAAAPFDYLFSITYLSIIPADVLAMAKKAAINFHDGPLPKYAGLNTPAWGLINREEKWGITFHLMTAGIDRGDILKQKLFEVGTGETALSLNTRSFATAIEAFGELINELAAGVMTPVPQDTSAERLYFSRHQRPAAAGVLDFDKSAVELDALIRGMDFGRYLNPLGSPKIERGGQALIVSRAALREDEEATGANGEILAADDKEILVNTSEGALALTGFQTLGGKDVAVADAAKALGLEAGASLGIPADRAERLTAIQATLAKSEEWWVKRLYRLEPVEIPYASASSQGEARNERVAVRIPEAFKTRFSARLADAVFAAYAAYLSRISGKDELQLTFADAALARELGELSSVVSTEVVVQATIDGEASFEAALERINAELTEVRAKRSFLHDVVARYPELHARPELVEGKLLPVGAAIADAPEGWSPNRPSTFNFVVASDGASASCVYAANVISSVAANEIKDQLETFLSSIAAAPAKKISAFELMSEAESRKVLIEWNRTETAFRSDACVHHIIEEQTAKTPDATAIVFEGTSYTYRELNARANQLAVHLKKLGIGPDKLVGIYVERSLDLMVATLGTQKAGGAYLPLDPAYPKDRIEFMIQDSKVEVILAQERLVPDLPASNAKIVRIDADWDQVAGNSTENVRGDVTPNHLAYVIYTSGSTGKPKGVQVEHHNVVNFFTGMDDRLPKEPPGTWLAVTSLSFDIHVLELFWTLARGFKVVVFLDRDRGQATKMLPKSIAAKGMQFGLFMWGNDDAAGRQKYELMLKGAKYFDEHNFDSVWTPERHFHAFGGPYPNPSVTGAALAAITTRLKIRAGSCVSPLHHPIRIAEEWAIVDNISDGRVGLSFASGWQPNDFVLQPQNHKNAKNVMLEQIETVRKLWRGEAIEFTNPMGQKVPTVTLPRPVQKELPFWVTTAGNPQTYKEAGYIGANILTHLLGQSVDEVAEKIKIYRAARKEKGFDPDTGVVTLMLHTFVGWDINDVREVVRQPMKDYLSASVSLVKNFAWAFPAFKRPQGENAKPDDIDLSSLTKEELDGILEFAFERYFEDSGLFGTPDSCMEMVNKLKARGVDEIACLLDFGVPTQRIMESLPQLKMLRDLANEHAGKSDDEMQDYSIAAQIRRHNVTHMQFTPSMGRMMLMHDESRAALSTVKHVFVGGEAFPVVLAKELGEVVANSVTNMYGPTETTIWSSTHPVKGAPDSIPIGRPIANTQLYILDKNRQPMPPGAPGELYIGGEGVVRGYLFRPELTAERFVANPFQDGRMYRTGDLARFARDGIVEFLGRTDHQVKIRGYRIELGEIETLLSKNPAVRECVVVLREDTPGDQRLVGYYVPHADAPEESALKDWMRAKLPEYMVPSHFAALDAMPLTPNGKIDRKQLPALDTLGPKAGAAEYVAPESEIETRIAEIWKETLNKEKIGIEDNFFDIGGHSLLVVRMHRKIKDALDKPVSLTDLYRFPTIKSFSDFLNSDGTSEAVKAGTDRAARRRDLLNKRRGRRPNA